MRHQHSGKLARSAGSTPRSRLLLEVLESRDTPAVVGVDATANVHAIDSNIYGSAFATTAQIADLHLTLNRDGGNSSDTYSFVQDATNHGSDWYFESISSGSGNGQGMDQFISDTMAAGAQASITLNLFDWAAKHADSSTLGSFPVSSYGAQQSTDPWNSNLGNGVHTNGTNITGNDPNIAYVPNSAAIEQAWIQHLIDTFGNSQNGGVQNYTLGNEPALWNSTHRDIHPNGETNTELLNDIIAYASMVKTLDPGAQILGPEEWGWTGYFIDGADAAAQNWGATYGGLNVQQWLLQQLHQYDITNGTRLLDYFTLHFYPQGGQFSDDVSTSMELLRNRSTRALWDPNYVDESWIASTGINGGKVNLINMMKSWVNTYYPGTKIGITEYNWGAEGNMNGATTQADIWGIFGREGLDLANRWTTPATGSPTYLAMKMYRNFDGNGGAFGDTSVGATVANPDQVDAFASIRSSDGALTVMVINKNLFDSANPGATTPITLNLSDFSSAGTAQVWQLAATNSSDQTNAAISRLSDLSLSGNSVTINVPMESVTLFVIPAASSAPAAPTGLKATAGDSRVTLSWNSATGATSYNVYRGTASGGETLLQSGITSTGYLDTAVTNGTTYYYRVSAVNDAGEGALSSEVSATPQVSAPSAPSNLNATAISTSQINLTWNDNSSNETAFVVEWATDSNFSAGFTSVTLGANTTSYSATGLTAGTTYWFRVRATNAGGASADSNFATASTFPGTTGHGLAATYYDNANFTGAQVSRMDSTINFNWGTGSPAGGIGANTFSAIWKGQIQAIESGRYRFRTRSDDGVRLWVNGHLLINDWPNHTARFDTSGFLRLVAGQKYDIEVDYHENTAAALIKLQWLRPGKTTYETISSSQLYLPSTTGTGLQATYFDNMDFSGTRITRKDATINFNWGTGSPAPAIGPDTFSVRWTGQVQAVESG
ncbi:MAG TPA: glycoside hydrolase family 44 protein, partial [Gemmata sp.]|nr:glycoside hydrolase family 44 protein [Gemmata sp.]